MKSPYLLGISALALVLAIPATVLADQAPAALTGVVSSAAEGAMEGVVVTAHKDGSIVSVSVTTDAQGRYSFPENRLEPGHYTLAIRAVGYDISAPAAADVVERTLAHDLLVRARRATARGACRRETPVTVTLEDGTLVEGVVDLAFEEDGEWIVVDYKTDREIAAAGEDRYRRQVALYASAIARATGGRASGILLLGSAGALRLAAARAK